MDCGVHGVWLTFNAVRRVLGHSRPSALQPVDRVDSSIISWGAATQKCYCGLHIQQSMNPGGAMDSSKSAIRQTLNQVKGFLAQELPPKLTEADTKANFIEPIIAALGWTGIGFVTREYYVKNSQEFIDYVMRGPSGLLLAIEAKALQADLTDKAAAQLIQYCSVEGIEWAALTNGRELQFFNTFLKPDLGAKRILSLDLLAFNSDEEFDALYQQLSQLSRENMTTPTGVRNWLNQRRMDATLRGIVFDPTSSINKQLRKGLDQAEIKATPQDIVQWFRSHLGTPITPIAPARPRQGTVQGSPTSRVSENVTGAIRSTSGLAIAKLFAPGESIVFRGDHQRLLPLFEVLRDRTEFHVPTAKWRSLKYYLAAETEGSTFLAVKRRGQTLVIGLTLPSHIDSPLISNNTNEFNWSRITKVISLSSETQVDSAMLSLIQQASAHASSTARSQRYFGVTIRMLMDKGLLQPGEQLILAKANHDLATATLAPNGDFHWNDRAYQTPSHRDFAALLGHQSLNGWTSWHVERPNGRQTLAEIRAELQSLVSDEESSLA